MANVSDVMGFVGQPGFQGYDPDELARAQAQAQGFAALPAPAAVPATPPVFAPAPDPFAPVSADTVRAFNANQAPTPPPVVKIEEPFVFNASPTPPATGPASQGAPAGIPPVRAATPGGGGPTSPAAAPAAPAPDQVGDFRKSQAETERKMELAQSADQRLADAQGQNQQATAWLNEERLKEGQRLHAERQKGIDRSRDEMKAEEDKTKNFKFTDWWSSRANGQKFMAGLGIILSGNSWEKNHTNTALEVIKQATRDDLELQKQKFQQQQYITGLKREGYLDAESQGRKADADYQLETTLKLKALGDTLEAQLRGVKSDAAKARGEAVLATFRQGQQESAQAFEQKHIAAEAARANIAKTRAETVTEQGKPALTRSQIAENYANAARLRASADGGVGGAPTKAEIFINKMFDKDEAALKGTPGKPGPVARYEQAQAASDALKEAIASGDKDRIIRAVQSVREQSTRLLTGAAPTKQTAHLIDMLEGSPDQLSRKLQSTFGKPAVGMAFAKQIHGLVEDITEEQRKIIDQGRERTVLKYTGPRGVARTPETKRAYEGRLAGVTGGVRNSDGSPRYAEGGQGQAAAAPAAKMVTITNGKTGETKQVTEDEARKLGALK